MDTLTLVGSNLTHDKQENELLTKNAALFPISVFKMFTYNYERWLYEALKLNKDHVRFKRLQTTQEQFLFPLEDCTLYIKKYKGFSEKLRGLVQAYLPFNPGLMESIKVSLWDESDTFFEMTVTSIEKTEENDYTVFYTHPSGEAMEVRGSELGNDEVVNLLTALIENDNEFMRKIPEKKKVPDMPIEETIQEPEEMMISDDYLYYEDFSELF